MSSISYSASPSKTARINFQRIQAVMFPHWMFWAVPTLLLGLCGLIDLASPRLSVAHNGYIVVAFWAPLAMLLMAWRYARFETFDWFLHRLWGVMVLFLWINYTINCVALFSHMLLAQNFPLADQTFLAADRALGLNWTAYAHFMLDNKWANVIFSNAYADLTMGGIMLTPVLALLRNDRIRVMEVCFLMLFTAITCVTISGFLPAYTATVHYDEIMKLMEADGNRYLGRAIAAMQTLRESPHAVIDPRTSEGLVCFPSFHCCMALIIWRCNRGLGWFSAVASIAAITIIAATPIFGGHYFVDVMAGGAVSAIAIWIWNTYISKNVAPCLPGTNLNSYQWPSFFQRFKFTFN